MQLEPSNSCIPEHQKELIQANRREIIRCLRVDGTLLNELLSKNVISEDTAATIRYTLIDSDKNRLLLDHVLQASHQMLEVFLHVLYEQQQGHLVPLFITNKHIGKYKYKCL